MKFIELDDGYKIEMPLCDGCKSNEHVEMLGPDDFGHEFHCEKCDEYWAQSI